MTEKYIKNGFSKLKEGWIKKGGVNNPPNLPKPSAPPAMNPKPSKPISSNTPKK